MWKTLLYRTKKGKSQVDDFIESLTGKEQGKVYAWIGELKQQGPTLPRPYADLLKDGIHELRLKLKGEQNRILYFFCFKNYVVLTNTFIKKTDKVPEKQIKIAKNCREDFLLRYNEKKLKEEYDDFI